MKKILLSLIVLIALGFSTANAQSGRITNEKEILDSLTTIEPSIIKYFPRWKICEPDLLFQISQHFQLMGYDKSQYNMQDIEILAAPREASEFPFEILLITSKDATMNAVQIESIMSEKLLKFLSGEFVYSGPNRGTLNEVAKRDYCYSEIPTETPLATSQAQAIIDYLQPTNVKHAFTLSLFDQAVKIGQTGFWLNSTIGTDPVGLPFWSAGEAKVVLKRPLYINSDPSTSQAIPYLINAYLGGGYRISTGLNNDGAFSWVSSRQLNAGPGGKIVAGFDFHMPFAPEFGLSFNTELPLKKTGTDPIEQKDYAFYGTSDDWEFAEGDYRNDLQEQKTGVAPLLRGTGQITAFYHWWLDKSNPENYFRFDLGLSYCEVRETALYTEGDINNPITYISTANIVGLKTFKPAEFGDWMFVKAEYRNQAAYPFGLSAQYSNQTILGKVWLPLFGDWFYLEGKYSTPLRSVRPFEVKNFFMISPVLRLTI